MPRAPTEQAVGAAGWDQPPERPAGEAGAIHVWRIGLHLYPSRVEPLLEILSPQERQRMARYRSGDLRRQMIAAHGRLRILLGRYVGADPRELEFRTAPRGKPYLVGSPRPLEFSLAHSGELALAAVHLDREVGVDVEAQRERIEPEGIAERFFSPAEAAWLRSLAGGERTEAFYRIWTAKEAFVKAHGAGLRFGLREFTVSVAGPYEIAEVRGDREEARRWSLWRLDPGPGYAGAVAARAAGLELKRYEWPLQWDGRAP